MKSHARLGGKYLMGAALTGAVLYLVTTATVHDRPLWPYLILVAAFVIGGVLFLVGQERPTATVVSGDHRGQEARSSRQVPATDPAPIRGTQVITDRWRVTNDGHQVPTLMQLRNNTMSHPGYTSRVLGENPPPSMRIGVVVPCEPLGPTPATSDIRARFLDFLVSQPVSDVLAGLTSLKSDARWAARDGHGRFNFGAVLDGDTDAAPVAWGRLLLPQADALRYGREPRSALLILLPTHAPMTGARHPQRTWPPGITGLPEGSPSRARWLHSSPRTSGWQLLVSSLHR